MVTLILYSFYCRIFYTLCRFNVENVDWITQHLIQFIRNKLEPLETASGGGDGSVY